MGLRTSPRFFPGVVFNPFFGPLFLLRFLWPDVGGEVFMALMSVVLLGRRLNLAQWCSLLVISGALLLSTVAEGKGGKKGRPCAPGRAEMGWNMLEHVGTCWNMESNMEIQHGIQHGIQHVGYWLSISADLFTGRSDLDLWD